jgi:hypothetical protein
MVLEVLSSAQRDYTIAPPFGQESMLKLRGAADHTGFSHQKLLQLANKLEPRYTLMQKRDRCSTLWHG